MSDDKSSDLNWVPGPWLQTNITQVDSLGSVLKLHDAAETFLSFGGSSNWLKVHDVDGNLVADVHPDRQVFDWTAIAAGKDRAVAAHETGGTLNFEDAMMAALWHARNAP